MAFLWSSLVSLVHRTFSSVREYFLGSSESTWDESRFDEPALEHDGGAENNSDRENGESASTANSGPIFKITIPSNTGNIVIGDFPTIKYVGNVGVVDCEVKKDAEKQSLSIVKKVPLKEEPQIVNQGNVSNRRKPRRGKTSSQKDITQPKVPAIIRRINQIERSLSKFRGNGEWLAHDKSIEKLQNEFRHDEDNVNIIFVLKFHKATCLWEKNEIEMAKKLVTEIWNDKKLGECLQWEKNNDIQNIVYCKCLLLISKIYCSMTRSLGKAPKALDLARRLLSQHLTNDELDAQFNLAYAWYLFCFNKINNCTSGGVKQVIGYTKKAEYISARFKDGHEEKWQDMRREILLLQCKAITQFYLDNCLKFYLNEEFADVYNRLMEELEQDLWSGICLRQKVDFHVLKSDYFKIFGKLAKSLDHAQTALQIARCKFNKDVLLLEDRIRELTPFPEDSVNDSEGLVKKVKDILTTTDGNVESNAAQSTDFGIFSTDESDLDSLLHSKQNDPTKSSVVKVRALAELFVKANRPCIAAVPYQSTSEEDGISIIIICLYLNTNGQGITADFRKNAEKELAGYKLEFVDLEDLQMSEYFIPEISEIERRPDEIVKIGQVIEKHLSIFKNRMNVTAVYPSCKISDRKETDQLCVAVSVLEKGRCPIGEEEFPAKMVLDGYPLDVVEGYYISAFDPIPIFSEYFPLRSGVSLGVRGQSGGGTLGAFLTDEEDLYVLSCKHVLFKKGEKVAVYDGGMNVDEKRKAKDQADRETVEYYISKAKKRLSELEGKASSGEMLSDREKNEMIKKKSQVREPISTEIIIEQPAASDFIREMNYLKEEVRQKEEDLENAKTNSTEDQFKTSQDALKVKNSELESHRKSKLPRDIARYSYGIKDNYTESGRTFFVDAAIAKLNHHERDKVVRCDPVLSVDSINGDVMPCSEVEKNVGKVKLWKCGRTTCLTRGARIITGGFYFKDYESVEDGDYDDIFWKVRLSAYCQTCARDILSENVQSSLFQTSNETKAKKCTSCGNEFTTNEDTSELWAKNCFLVKVPHKLFVDAGDSGAVVYDEEEGRAWGIVVGSYINSAVAFGVVSPLDITLKALNSISGKNLRLWRPKK